MPVLIETAFFTDVFGNVEPFYKSNAGDKIAAKFTVRSAIRITSVTAPLTLDPSTNQVTSPVTSWLEEGFRVGTHVRVRRHTSGGAVMATFWTSINYVDDFMADFGAMPQWYNATNGQFLVMLAVEGPGSNVAKGRDDLDVLFNHSPNAQPGGEFSLIDGEATRSTFLNVAAMIVGATINGNLVGNQSGQFVLSSDLTRQANNFDGWRVHDIDIIFSQSGAYDAAWFNSSDCLKVFMRMEWAAVSAEPFDRTISIYNNEANTGFFNSAHNSSITDSTLTQGVASLDYCVPSTFDIAVDGPLTEIGIGGLYISTDPAYYKSRPFPQQKITMLLPTVPAVIGSNDSDINEFGAGYTIEINSIIVALSVTTLNVTFTPNAQFNSFMAGVEDGDRLFYLWVKCGNLNLTAFAGQLTCEPPVGGPLIMVQDFGYLDHSLNVETATGDNTGFVADTEDDVAYLGRFLLEKNVIYDSFEIEMQAFETTTLDAFELQKAFFSFAGVQISNDGRYLLDELASMVNTLPGTSVKINAKLTLDPSLDTPTHYGVKIYGPWLLNWKYWLTQQNANVDFYPTQNKNWEQYDNLNDWTIRTRLILVENGLAYTHANTIIVEPYDNEAQIDSTIEVLQLPALTAISVVPTNSIVRIKSKHVNLAGAWDQSTTWGMLTVEPFEAESRWICSSAVDFDNNTNNPLTPLAGLLIVITYPSPDTAVMDCFFDTSKIDLTNGVKITAKIKEKDKAIDGFLLTFKKEAALGYSVMKVANDITYIGPIMKVRRSLDNTEMDFTALFDGLNWVVDTVAILAFTGVAVGNNGFVTYWYDQSGSERHAFQEALADQPPIVLDGAIIVSPENGFPALDFDGVNHNFDVFGPPITTTNYLQAYQFRRNYAGFGPIRSVGLGNSNSYPYPFLWTLGVLFDGMGNQFGPNNVHASAQITPGSYLNISYRQNTFASIEMRQNGVQLLTILEPNTATFLNKVGRQGAGHNAGLMQELVYYDGLTNLVFVEGNINLRYITF